MKKTPEIIGFSVLVLLCIQTQVALASARWSKFRVCRPSITVQDLQKPSLTISQNWWFVPILSTQGKRINVVSYYYKIHKPEIEPDESDEVDVFLSSDPDQPLCTVPYRVLGAIEKAEKAVRARRQRFDCTTFIFKCDPKNTPTVGKTYRTGFFDYTEETPRATVRQFPKGPFQMSDEKDASHFGWHVGEGLVLSTLGPSRFTISHLDQLAKVYRPVRINFRDGEVPDKCTADLDMDP